MRLVTRKSFLRLGAFFLLSGVALVAGYILMIRMPGTSFRGELPPVTDAQRDIATLLERHVQALAGDIGRRNVFHTRGLRAAEAYLENSLHEAGYRVEFQTFRSGDVEVHNLIAELPGTNRPSEIVVIGAHYDSVDDCPAANDNGSGVAATLVLAQHFMTLPTPPARTLRFVLFVNEEPPHFQQSDMGSLVYARQCRERNENIIAMISLETIGCYSHAPGSQNYPIEPIGWFYPDVGNFIAFVGDFRSRHLVRQALGTFRDQAKFPSEGAALPGWITGIGWSDHWAFWQYGYPAIMITDTALFRYPHYHQNTDTPDKLDYESTARVVHGMIAVIEDLAQTTSSPVSAGHP